MQNISTRQYSKWDNPLSEDHVSKIGVSFSKNHFDAYSPKQSTFGGSSLLFLDTLPCDDAATPDSNIRSPLGNDSLKLYL